MKAKEQDDLVNRAMAKATGSNIHDLRVLCAYYRNACTISPVILEHWPAERIAKRRQDIEKYERVLEHFADTGQWLEELRRV